MSVKSRGQIYFTDSTATTECTELTLGGGELHRASNIRIRFQPHSVDVADVGLRVNRKHNVEVRAHTAGASEPAPYVVFGNSPSEVKSVLDDWGLGDHEPLLVYASECQSWAAFVKTLKHAVNKADRCHVKIACIIVHTTEQRLRAGSLKGIDGVPCLKLVRVFCSPSTDLTPLSGDLDVNFLGYKHRNDDEVQDSKYNYYIFAHVEKEVFISLLSPLAPSLVIYSGDNIFTKFSQSDSTLLGLIRDGKFGKCMNVSPDIIRGNIFCDELGFIPLSSIGAQSLFLWLLGDVALSETTIKALVEIDKGSRNWFIQRGVLFSDKFRCAHSDGSYLKLCKKYCITKNRYSRFPELIKQDLADFKYDQIVSFHLKSVKGEEQANLSDFYELVHHVKNKNKKCLCLIFDDDGQLFSKSQEHHFGRRTEHLNIGESRCLGIVPRSKVGGFGEDQLIVQLPISDMNLCVDSYMFFDTNETEGSGPTFFHSFLQNLLKERSEPSVTDAVWVCPTHTHIGTRLDIRMYGEGLKNPRTMLYSIHPLSDANMEFSAEVILSCGRSSYDFTSSVAGKTQYINDFLSPQQGFEQSLLVQLYRNLIKPSTAGKENGTAWVSSVCRVIQEMLKVGFPDTTVVTKAYVLSGYLSSLNSINYINVHSKCKILEHPSLSSVVHKRIAENIAKEGLQTDSFSDNPELLQDIDESMLCLWPILAHLGRTDDISELLKFCSNKHILPYILYVSGVLKSRLKGQPGRKGIFKSIEEYDRLQVYAENLQVLAEKILHAVFVQNKEASQEMLFAEIHSLKKHNSLKLARMADAKSFISSQACVEALRGRWWGDMPPASWLKTLLYILLPCLYVRHKNRRKQDITNNNSLKQMSTGNASVHSNESIDEETVSNEASSCSNPVECNTGYTCSRSSTLSCCSSLFSEYQIPAVKCFIHYVFFFTFLLLYSYMILTGLENEIQTIEYVVFGWMITFIIEEILQGKRTFSINQGARTREKILDHFAGFWNILDVVGMTVYLIAVCCRLVAYFIHEPTLLTLGHGLMSIDAIVLFIRGLQFSAMHPRLGPLIIMVGNMCKDLWYFMLILMVVLVGYGVAMHSILFPHSLLRWGLVREIVHIPYVQIYGEISFEEILVAPNGTDTSDVDSDPGFRNYLGLILAGFYLLFTNILLINLLIAMFNSSYEKAIDETEYHNAMHMTELLSEYEGKYVIPPPFTLLTYIPRIVCALNKYVATKCPCSNNDPDVTTPAGQTDQEVGDIIKAAIAKHYEDLSSSVDGQAQDIRDLKEDVKELKNTLVTVNGTIERELNLLCQHVRELQSQITRVSVPRASESTA